jgi:hypothetical protein
MPAYGLGRVPSPPDPRDHTLALHAPEVAAAPPPGSYAPHYLWTVLDQGDTPRCVGYSGALGRQIESMLEAHEALLFDADDLYTECKRIDGSPNADGTYIRVACQVLRNEGGLVKQVLAGLTPAQIRARLQRKAASEAAALEGAAATVVADLSSAISALVDWLEATHRHQSAPAPAPPAVEAGSRLKISAYSRLNTLTEVKQAISVYGDAWIGSPWANSWFQPGKDGSLPAADQPAGGHAYKFVGFDDSRSAFLLHNSWGEGWGLLGHAWMPYSYVLIEQSGDWEAWETFS